MDRRNELLFEMKAKADMAREQERADAEGYVKAYERGRAIGDDRRFSKFREDIRPRAAVRGMSEDELRGCSMRTTTTRLWLAATATTSQRAPTSAMTPGGAQPGASGKVIAGLNEEYRGILAPSARPSRMQIGTRDERRYAEQRERDMLLFGQRKELQG